MTLGLIMYIPQPSTLTAALSAVFGMLLVATIIAIGLFMLKYKADKKRMSQDEYVYYKNKTTNLDKKKNRHGKKGN